MNLAILLVSFCQLYESFSSEGGELEVRVKFIIYNKNKRGRLNPVALLVYNMRRRKAKDIRDVYIENKDVQLQIFGKDCNRMEVVEERKLCTYSGIVLLKGANQHWFLKVFISLDLNKKKSPALSADRKSRRICLQSTVDIIY